MIKLYSLLKNEFVWFIGNKSDGRRPMKISNPTRSIFIALPFSYPLNFTERQSHDITLGWAKELQNHEIGESINGIWRFILIYK